MLLLMSKRKCVYFIAFYDKEILCGFTYLIHYKNMMAILYLAVNPKIHSKGHGSKIFKLVKEKYAPNNIVLNIDIVDEKFYNYKERLKKQHFYFKNEFYDS